MFRACLIKRSIHQTTVEALDDEALFRMDEDEEEDGAFVMCADLLLYYHLAHHSFITFYRGNFADALGDDFLGLRELGIADEFGMSSLSVPKKLLKGKNKGENKLSASACVWTRCSITALLTCYLVSLIVYNRRNLRCHTHPHLPLSISTRTMLTIRLVSLNLITKSVFPCS